MHKPSVNIVKALSFGLALASFTLIGLANAQNSQVIEVTSVPDFKAVYATVESTDVIPARARLGGTIVSLNMNEGDVVQAGQVLAIVVDDRLAPQVRAVDARIDALTADFLQARIDFDRVKELFETNVVAQARLDAAQTRIDVAAGQLASAREERSVLVQQQKDGEILSPTTGVVLQVDVTPGTVVGPGEPVAVVAAENLVLRLRLPERHARFLTVGSEIRVDRSELGETVAGVGTIVQVYPQILAGRVMADAAVEGLGDFFVGERVRIWVSVGSRDVILLPISSIETRFGIDFVRLENSDGSTKEVIIQRGRDHEDGLVEVLSGLHVGDVVSAR